MEQECYKEKSKGTDYIVHSICDECSCEYLREPDYILHDRKVPFDGHNPFRAINTLPDGLKVTKSKIPGAGLGIWTLREFPIYTRFGPYGGVVGYNTGEEEEETQCSSQDDDEICRPDPICQPDLESGYAWQLFTNDEETHFVDAQCMNSSTWLRFVNTARNYSEQNVVAYQDEGQIYYMSFRQIPKNTELLVWYGSSDYDELLGIDTDKYKAEVKCPDKSCLCPDAD